MLRMVRASYKFIAILAFFIERNTLFSFAHFANFNTITNSETPFSKFVISMDPFERLLVAGLETNTQAFVEQPLCVWLSSSPHRLGTEIFLTNADIINRWMRPIGMAPRTVGGCLSGSWLCHVRTSNWERGCELLVKTGAHGY